MIVLAGTIGAGKTSLTQMLADHLGSKPFLNRSMTTRSCPSFTKTRKSTGSCCRFTF